MVSAMKTPPGASTRRASWRKRKICVGRPVLDDLKRDHGPRACRRAGGREARRRRLLRRPDPRRRHASTETGLDSIPLAGMPAARSSRRNSPRPHPTSSTGPGRSRRSRGRSAGRARSPPGCRGTAPRRARRRPEGSPEAAAKRPAGTALPARPAEDSASVRRDSWIPARRDSSSIPREVSALSRSRLSARPDAGRERKRVERRLVPPEKAQRPDREPLRRREGRAVGNGRRQDLLGAGEGGARFGARRVPRAVAADADAAGAASAIAARTSSARTRLRSCVESIQTPWASHGGEYGKSRLECRAACVTPPPSPPPPPSPRSDARRRRSARADARAAALAR